MSAQTMSKPTSAAAAMTWLLFSDKVERLHWSISERHLAFFCSCAYAGVSTLPRIECSRGRLFVFRFEFMAMARCQIARTKTPSFPACLPRPANGSRSAVGWSGIRAISGDPNMSSGGGVGGKSTPVTAAKSVGAPAQSIQGVALPLQDLVPMQAPHAEGIAPGTSVRASVFSGEISIHRRPMRANALRYKIWSCGKLYWFWDLYRSSRARRYKRR